MCLQHASNHSWKCRQVGRSGRPCCCIHAWTHLDHIRHIVMPHTVFAHYHTRGLMLILDRIGIFSDSSYSGKGSVPAIQFLIQRSSFCVLMFQYINENAKITTDRMVNQIEMFKSASIYNWCSYQEVFSAIVDKRCSNYQRILWLQIWPNSSFRACVKFEVWMDIFSIVSLLIL